MSTPELEPWQKWDVKNKEGAAQDDALPFKWYESERPREMDHPSEYIPGDLSLC